jgi:hypothetical protein
MLLIVAGAAKFADLASFSSTVRLFVPHALPRYVRDGPAFGIAAVEVALGAASLSLPAIAWLNLAVLALAAAFIVVSVAGFAFHRGRACRCFGALSQRQFDFAGIVRSIGIAALAAIATSGVRPSVIDVNLTGRMLLLVSSGLLALAAFAAAHALAISHDFQAGVATK